jgi:CIC family chloride channel protein
MEIHRLTGIAFLGLLIGVFGGFGAIGFRLFLNRVQALFFGAPEGHTFFWYVKRIPWYQRLIIPMGGGLLIGPLIYFFSEKVKGHGVPEVLESIVLKGGKMKGRIVPLKALASAISIGSGGSAGREGPIVQIGSAFGSAVGQFLKLDEQKIKTLIGCGASAGIAGTFNAPIGGIIFSIEILLEDFHINDTLPVVLSSVVSAALCQAYFGPSPAFPIPEFTFLSSWEFVFYAFLGVAAGIIGLIFIKTLYATERLFESTPLPVYVKPALGGLLIGSLALWFPQVYGVGYHVIELALHNELAVITLLSFLFAKVLATNLTLGSGGSGGIFAPALFMGALLGSAYGQVVTDIFPAITSTPGSYAVAGMASLFAGVAHAPMTAIVIMFEMTRNYKIILPLILSSAISVTITGWIKEGNIYTTKLLKRGIKIREGKEVGILKEGKVRDAMKSDVISIDHDASLSEIHDIFVDTHHTHYPVTRGNGGENIAGMINYTDHWSLLEEFPREDWIVADDLAKETPTVHEGDSLDSALEKLSQFHVELLPVVDRDGELVGVLSRNDIINAYNRLLRSDEN